MYLVRFDNTTAESLGLTLLDYFDDNDCLLVVDLDSDDWWGEDNSSVAIRGV